MVSYLFPIHRWMGHTLSAVVLILVVWSIVLAVRSGEDDRISEIVMKAGVGLIDLQILLGLFLYIGRSYVNTWHPVLGILAAISLHAGNKLKNWARVGSFVVGSVCVTGAVMLVVG